MCGPGRAQKPGLGSALVGQASQNLSLAHCQEAQAGLGLGWAQAQALLANNKYYIIINKNIFKITLSYSTAHIQSTPISLPMFKEMISCRNQAGN